MSVQYVRLWPRRPPDGSLPLGLSCDDEGLLLAGNCRLIEAWLDRDGHVFYRARLTSELNALFTAAYGEPIDASPIYPAIEQIAQLMTARNWTRATLAALHLRLPELADRTAAERVLKIDALLKVTASFDPDKHPRWPKGSQEGHGGEFSPSGGSGDGSIVPVGLPQDWSERDRQARLRIKQIDPLILPDSGHLVLPSGGAPGFGGGATVAIIAARIAAAAVAAEKIAKELGPLLQMLPALKSYLDTYINGPSDLKDLRVSDDSESFKTMYAFVKRYGQAGEGWQYDHLVEQNSTNLKEYGAETLHSTDNIIRVPLIWHERMSDYYSGSWPDGGTVRDHVNSLSWDEQVAFKLNKYREWGVIK